LTLEDKLNALKQLGDVDIFYSDYTKCFYVSVDAEIKHGGFLTSPTEHRKTKEETIEATFERYANADVVVVDAYKPSRKELKFIDGRFQ
jgi:hypothetical protein